MMRIIAGTARRRPLETLDGDEITRPTAERVKEGLFSAIQFELEGRRVLDLFSGCGQLALEALSRGAESAVLIDGNVKAVEVIKKNAKTTELITDARRVVAYSIIQEFFDDINEVILVGVWDNSYETPLWQPQYPASAGIDHIEVDSLGHIVKVAMRGESTEITPNMVVFGNKLDQ